MTVRISEAARKLGIHPATLRNLEKKGLITVQRDWANYRRFTEADLQFISEKLFKKPIEEVGDER
jgi:DNA-binding transcriptional MerR regulator